MQLCLQREFPEEKSQSLHSQKPSWWAQQIRHKRKNLYFEYCKNVLYAGPKLFDKLRPGPTYYSAGNIISQDFNCLGCCRLSATRSRSGLPYLKRQNSWRSPLTTDILKVVFHGNFICFAVSSGASSLEKRVCRGRIVLDITFQHKTTFSLKTRNQRMNFAMVPKHHIGKILPI